ncbi:alpha/beta fold hydrolase [Streptomyces pakalii]|uniref:Alpha/beta fold hydrolase n=1 Tax=Streptomyces pakalii TaxID=3036494 RepID=A0ABT7D0X4_9ACTN|nr:alpha/beta fold hydrolase [Streptomyces pakalii]MDJ1639451.1 alpha/beta fold hydrolase [Streptomyces pakalii]
MERTIAADDGLLLWAETFGDRRDPAVLLVMGATAPGIVWPDGLCRLLASAGYYVVRYDHRDTGRSGKSPAAYDLSTLAADAAAVIARLGAGPAHVVGQSAGGTVSLLLALARPGLVRSLVLLSSSPGTDAGARRSRTGPSDASEPEAGPPAAGPEERRAMAVEGWRGLVGDAVPFDRAYWSDLVDRVAEHSSEPDTSVRHLAAMARTPALTDRITALRVPTLVVHGEQDRVFPMKHGEALRRAIPDARLRRIPGMGHIFPPHWSSTVGALIVGHLRRNSGGGEKRHPGVLPQKILWPKHDVH